jgi:hypothetical protein
MNVYDFGLRASSQQNKAHRYFDDNIEYLLSVEERFLQSISDRVPLTEVLNGICSALDCQIGNVISLISLPGDDLSDVATIARNAERFGLHTFYSEGVVGANNEILGSLEMYSSVQRSPYISEIQLIERAKLVAAIAIKRNIDAEHQGNFRENKNLSELGCLPEWQLRTLFFAHLKKAGP